MLAGPMTFSGIGFPATSGNNSSRSTFTRQASAASASDYPGGTLAIMNTSVLPTTTRLGLPNGLVDLGANSITLGSVTFTNDLDFTPFNPATGSAGVGIIGTGTLSVTGDINVLSSPASFNSRQQLNRHQPGFRWWNPGHPHRRSSEGKPVGGAATDRRSFQWFAPQDLRLQPKRHDGSRGWNGIVRQ